MNRATLLILLISTLGGPASGQWINTLWHVPANPTAGDPITFFADVSFPSGSCDQHSQQVFVNGNTVDANALHCLGALTFICGYTDTFQVGPLSAGNYTFRFHVDNGGLPFPCTAGINPGPTDSITFTVSPAVGISVQFPVSGVEVFTSPACDILHVHSQLNRPVRLALYSIAGNLVLNRKVVAASEEIPIGHLQRGFYYVRVENGDFNIETRRIAIVR